MLNSSAVLNGQPAILAWSVTSIQPPPETIRAWPINQPIHYPRANSDPCSFPAASLRSPHRYPHRHPHRPGRRPTSRFAPSLPPAPRFSPGRLPVARPTSPYPRTLPVVSRRPLDNHSTPFRSHANPPRRIDNFFFTPSRIRARRFVRSMKVLPDGVRRAMCVIAKHAMRATGGFSGIYRKCTSLPRAFSAQAMLQGSRPSPFVVDFVEIPAC